MIKITHSSSPGQRKLVRFGPVLCGVVAFGELRSLDGASWMGGSGGGELGEHEEAGVATFREVQNLVSGLGRGWMESCGCGGGGDEVRSGRGSHRS